MYFETMIHFLFGIPFEMMPSIKWLKMPYSAKLWKTNGTRQKVIARQDMDVDTGTQNIKI